MNRPAALLSIRSLVLAVVAASFCAGCVGEAGVRYRGSVAAAPTPGYSFDAAANPGGLSPIAGAEVRMCVCAPPCPCEKGKTRNVVKTDASGVYALPDFMFPGMIGVEHEIVIVAEAEGHEPFRYSCNYEKRSSADREREPSQGQKQLNFRLRPTASPKAAVSAVPWFFFAGTPIRDARIEAAVAAILPPPGDAGSADFSAFALR